MPREIRVSRPEAGAGCVAWLVGEEGRTFRAPTPEGAIGMLVAWWARELALEVTWQESGAPVRTW